MSTLDLVEYYKNLLIFQYLGLSRARSTIEASVTPMLMPQQSVQTISFSPAPTSGTFVLSYDDTNTSSIAWDDSSSAIQIILRQIPALSAVTVTGSIADGLTVNFVGVSNVALLLEVQTNTLSSSGNSVAITIAETDLTLPLAVQEAFNLNTAVGVQLNILGKYAGVVRTYVTPDGTITLGDDDYRNLIKFAITKNNSGSSLADIERNLNKFFPGQFLVNDFKNMTMSFIFSGSIGTTDFFVCLVQAGLVPVPMAVLAFVFIPPLLSDYFGYRTYESNNPNAKPYNTYDNVDPDGIYLSYSDAIIV